METLDAAGFKEKIIDFENSKEWNFKGSRPAIVDFYADWCGPCHSLAPILENVAEKYKNQVDIYKVNTEHSPELAAMFGIRSIPTLLFIPINGDPEISTGVIPEEEFDHAILEVFGIKSGE